MAMVVTNPRGNRLLARLSSADATYLGPLLKVVTLEQGQVLSEPGDGIEKIYFPHTGVVSLLAVMRDGRTIETVNIGREGAVGTIAGLGQQVTLTRNVVQVSLVASQITTAQFRKAIEFSNTFRDLIARYNHALFGQLQISAACNALHPLHSRMARWILQMRDRTDDDSFPLTQELLSEILGVRRSSVSEVAGKMQESQTIHYSRGNIRVIDVASLKEIACECYDTIKQRFEDELDEEPE